MPALRPSLRLVARLLVASAIAWLGLLAVGAAPASAHATVVSSDPRDGSDSSVAPTQVSITFDESVGLQPGYLRVVDSGGHRVDTGSAFHPSGRGATVSVALKPNLPSAAYIASYRVVSADSHPVGGVVRFSVGGASLASVAAVGSGSSTDTSVSVLLDVARAVSFTGLALAGGWWLVLLIAGSDEKGTPWPRSSRQVVAGGLIAAFAGALVELIAQGPYAAGTGLGGLGRGALLSDTLASSFGLWHLAQLALLAVLAVVVLSPVHIDAADFRRTGWALGGTLWLAVLICVAATGHAAVRRPIWLGQLSTVLHLVAMSVWVGGLAVLAASVLRARTEDPAVALRALPIFSTVAGICVGALAVTGSYQAYREVGGWSALVDTEYGVLVLVKIGLFLLLIGLGYLARTRLRRLGNAGPAELRRLRIGVLIEVAIAVTVLSVTGVLVAQPPGDASASAAVTAGSGSRTVALSSTRTLTLTITPPRAGSVVVDLLVSPGPEVQKMTLTAQLPSASIGPIPVAVTDRDAQRFRSGPLTLPLAGLWQFTVTVQTSAFDIISATVSINVN